MIDEGGRNGEREEKLHAVDGADHLARLGSLHQQIGGHHRPPAAAARRIEKAADEAERRDHAGALHLGRIEQAAGEQIDAHQRQIGKHEGLHHGRIETGEQIGARNAADDAGDQQAAEQRPVDIAAHQMANARNGGGEHFHHMHLGRGLCRWNAEQRDKHGVGNHAKGHAQRAVNRLGGKTDEDERENCGEIKGTRIRHGTALSRMRCASDYASFDRPDSYINLRACQAGISAWNASISAATALSPRGGDSENTRPRAPACGPWIRTASPASRRGA